MISHATKSILLGVFIAAALIGIASFPAFVPVSAASLEDLCHNGIDDDNDNTIDLLDRDCAEFRPDSCPDGQIIGPLLSCIDAPDNTPDSCSGETIPNGETCSLPECSGDQVPNDDETMCVDPTPSPVENTAELCSDGIDNDNDQAIDLADGDCAAFIPVENTAGLCSDTVDNDLDEAIDLADSDCAAFVPVTPPPAPSPAPTPTPPPPPPSGGGNGNGPIVGSFGGGGSFVPGGNGNGPIAGQVLGASTSALPELPAGCSPLISSYMRLGKSNDSEQVKMLQEFLNKHLGLSIEVSGFFGKETDAGVRQFQLAHVPQVLTPWGIDYATGYVYKTTSRWINLTSCSSLDIPMPVLN